MSPPIDTDLNIPFSCSNDCGNENNIPDLNLALNNLAFYTEEIPSSGEFNFDLNQTPSQVSLDIDRESPFVEHRDSETEVEIHESQPLEVDAAESETEDDFEQSTQQVEHDESEALMNSDVSLPAQVQGCRNEERSRESTCSNPTTYSLYYLFQNLKMLNFFPFWLFPKPKDVVAANPMSDINAPQTKYDVFVSFSGEDIRDNLLSHLVKAFDGKKIKHFVDDGLKRGEEIWSSLAEAIEESSISLIIFSEKYATSRWCLQELVHILECRKNYKRIVIPVFYHVDPTDVRHQTGRSYETAFAKHRKKYNSTEVQSWRDALKESTNLSGITSSNCRNDAVLIDEIVSLVLTRLSLSKNPVNSNGLFGIEKQIEAVESLLNKELEGTRFIGIWGIGGIGKTTIADAIFNKLRSEYGGSCFLSNVREDSTRHGKDFLKEKLFSKLLDENVKLDTPNGLPDHVKRRVQRIKVLIVLDDVNDSDQVKNLVGNGDWFGSGSTVIITARDKQVIPTKNDYVHEVRTLEFDDALDLFNLNAFEHSRYKKEEYCELSKKVVKYAEGIPLVLIVLGGHLCKKNKEIWESELNKLQKMPHKKVYESLKLSYDDLDRKEQGIFLDLACFLVGLNLKVERIKNLLKEGENDKSVAVGLERLKDRALITFSEDDGVSMHDVIQETAREIVVHECREDPGRRSRLEHPDDIYQVLQNDKGSEAIRSIKVPFTAFRKLKLSPHIFAKMSKLQFLHDLRKNPVREDEMDLLPQGLQYLPTELRYFVWWQYPLKSLPEKFSAEKLVILNLSYSKVEKLWPGVQNLVNLKEVRLCYSKFLKELPDFSKATNLELLDTWYCRQLTNVHPCIFSLEKLDELNLGYCEFLSGLPTEIHLRSLSYLNLQRSKNPSEFSVTISENMIELYLQYTRVIALAAAFGSQYKLESLDLDDCYYIESLPSCFNKFTNLTSLSISRCKELKTLPELPSSLGFLYAEDCTSLETISFPSIVEQFRENRVKVEFWNCLKLDERSLVAIGLNARINMMNYACQHLPAAHDDSFTLKCWRGFEADYVYPGSSVPEWFVYKTTEDYIVIDLPAPNSPPILGFIFCFVLRKFPYDQFVFNITICDDEDEGKGDSVHLDLPETYTDHVCVMYDQIFSRFLISRARNLRRLKIKVAVEEYTSDFYPRLETTEELIRGFGVYPINTTPHHDFIKRWNSWI